MPRLAALLFVPLLALPQAKPQEKPQSKEKPPEEAEETVAAHRGNLVPVFELEATYEPVESTELKLRMEAYQGDLTIVKVATAGELVKKGDPLLTLDRAPLERQIASVENDLHLARATYDKAQADLTIGAKADSLALILAQTAVSDAEVGLRSFEEVDGKHMVQQADLNVRFLEDGLHDQAEELTQLEKMYKSEELTNATSEIVVRRARRGIERTKTALEMSRSEAENVKSVKYTQQRRGLAHAIEVAKNTLDGVLAAQALSRVQRDAEVAKSRFAVTQLEEQLGKLKRDLEGFCSVASIDGRVFYGQFQHGSWGNADQVTSMLVPGEKAQTGQVLMTVCGSRTRVRADLAEPDYFDVAAGSDASVVPVASPEAKSEGTIRVKSFVPASKGAGSSFEVRIDFKEPPGNLLPGMKGKATVRGREIRDAVLVPSSAVAAQGGKCTLTVSKDGKNASREVTVGKTDGKMTQIKTGLEPGERVCLQK